MGFLTPENDRDPQLIRLPLFGGDVTYWEN